MSQRIIEILNQHTAVLEGSLVEHAHQLENSAAQLAQMFASGGHLLVAAGGGLMGVADAIVHGFLYNLGIERPSLPALSLNGNIAFAAALSETDTFTQYYSAGIQAAARPADTVMFLAAEVSAPLLAGIEAARELECTTLVLSAADADPWIDAGADTVIALQASSLARGAEGLLCYGHILCELVERELFGF
jgi:D-sedoheptulose 7-phosphate isomerase